MSRALVVPLVLAGLGALWLLVGVHRYEPIPGKFAVWRIHRLTGEITLCHRMRDLGETTARVACR